MGFFNKIKQGLKKTRESISGSIGSMLNSFTKIDEELFEELEELLVMGDVGMPTAEKICAELRTRVKEEGVTDPQLIMGMIQDIVAEMISGDEELHIQTEQKMTSPNPVVGRDKDLASRFRLAALLFIMF